VVPERGEFDDVFAKAELEGQARDA
jgi:hypothetical protein